MHNSLVQVSNINFYSFEISTGYTRPKDKRFFDLKVPFVFINVGKRRSQKLIDTSFKNRDEVKAVIQFVKFWLEYVKTKKHHNT